MYSKIISVRRFPVKIFQFLLNFRAWVNESCINKISGRLVLCSFRNTENVTENKDKLVVPTPLVGEGTIYSNGFFCSVNFG